MRLYQIDAFTEQAFRGNPAAVCLLDGERDERWMQDVAAEMNLSETAFLLPRGDDYSLRWFTPAAEVALCGHATLASAHALFEEQGVRSARFHTKSGVLTSERDGEWIELDFPARVATPCEPPWLLLESLGIREARYVGRNIDDYLIEVATEEELRGLAPDFARLGTLPVRGVVVTSRGSDYDFISRFFGPRVGVNEDPVTGSSHCALTPYWAAKLGRNDMTAYQASKRGGVVRVRLAGDRVKLIGQAVTVFRGELNA